MTVTERGLSKETFKHSKIFFGSKEMGGVAHT